MSGRTCFAVYYDSGLVRQPEAKGLERKSPQAVQKESLELLRHSRIIELAGCARREDTPKRQQSFSFLFNNTLVCRPS
jgi:hypothetical protein